MEVYPNLNWLEALFNWHLWEVNLNKHFVTGMASYKVNTKCEMTFLVICEQATLLAKSYFLFGFLRRLLDFLFCSCRSHRNVGKNQNGRFDEISSMKASDCSNDEFMELTILTYCPSQLRTMQINWFPKSLTSCLVG